MTALNCTTVVNPRAQRGRRIAERFQLKPSGDIWWVPSESSNGKYKVYPAKGRCTCADNEVKQQKCKHLHAVEFTIRRKTTRTEETVTVNGESATTITETVKTTKTARVTYSQDWPAYNAAQTLEKDLFITLLYGLCKGIKEPPQTMGRPRLPLADMVFAAAFKVFVGFSGRRFMSDLRAAHGQGYLSCVPHFNSIFNYIDDADLTPLLHKLITVTSLPLRAVEADFAIDSSGFSTTGTVTWFNTKFGHDVDNHDWIKLHLVTGVKTNVVTSATVSGRDANDAPFLPALVDDTARNFTLRELSADKAYSSVKNLEAIAEWGADPFVPFKSNTTGDGGGNSLWRRLWGYYQFQRDEFLPHYHKRSNVETTFFMIKSKFGGKLWSKSETAQVNEALLKVICHNIVVLVQSIYELNIAPVFWGTAAPALRGV
jgi:transposase